MVSGTRQTQQRHSINKANYVTSPPLTLAYALAGNVLIDLEHETIGFGDEKTTLHQIWPSRQSVEEIEDEFIIKKLINQIHEKIEVKINLFSLQKQT